MNVPLNIDFQQILLHLFNFEILAFGLYFLLYKPVKEFMDKRQTDYAAIRREAEDCLERAKAKEELHNTRLAEIDAEIARRQREASEYAESMKQRRIMEAEDEAARLIASARQAAGLERSKLLEEAREEISGMAVEAVKKLLEEDLGRSYDEFLSAAERSEANEQQ